MIGFLDQYGAPSTTVLAPTCSGIPLVIYDIDIVLAIACHHCHGPEISFAAQLGLNSMGPVHAYNSN